MLGLGHLYITSRGKFVGVISRTHLIKCIAKLQAGEPVNQNRQPARIRNTATASNSI